MELSKLELTLDGKMESVPMKLQLSAGVALALILAIAPGGALGQSSLEPGRLPQSTVFYLAWHGMPSGEARTANSLLGLWDDPGFAPLRDALIEALLKDSGEGKKIGARLTREELNEFASLLDNELVVGYVGDPNPAKAVRARKSPASKWNGMFLVYDRTGKEATVAKWLLRARMGEKDPSKITATTLAGIPAIKLERTAGTSYWAEDGRYAFTAGEPAVFGQIANWTRRSAPAAASLSETAAYQEAGDLLKGGVLDLFFHFPSVKEFAGDQSAAGFRVRPLLENMGIDAAHSIAGHLSLEGSRTRMEGAILGQAVPGTLFDIWDDGVAAPSSSVFITPDLVSFQQSRINLLGIYELVRRALQSTVPAGQQGPMDFLEGAAKTRLGMTIPEALGLFSGEFTSLESNPALDPAKRVFVVGIQKKPETVKLLRVLLADRVAGERTEGDSIFFKVSQGGIQSAAGTASWKYYHLAVTNDAIVISSRLESIRETLAARKGNHGGDANLPKDWLAARAQFPKLINGLSFVDFQKVDWAAVKEQWKMESNKAKSSAASRAKPTSEPSALDHAIDLLEPQLLNRHLHQTASAFWKNSQGLHLDGWID
jgi:hypothetical protein